MSKKTNGIARWGLAECDNTDALGASNYRFAPCGDLSRLRSSRPGLGSMRVAVVEIGAVGVCVLDGWVQVFVRMPGSGSYG